MPVASVTTRRGTKVHTPIKDWELDDITEDVGKLLQGSPVGRTTTRSGKALTPAAAGVPPFVESPLTPVARVTRSQVRAMTPN
jgi:hypothetical protein